MSKNPGDIVTFSTPDLQAILDARLTPPPFLKGDLEILSEKSPPPRIIHREREMQRIIEVLSSAVMRSHPSHIVIYGKTGSGKTACTNRALEMFKGHPKLPREFVPVYVNCRNQVSHHGLLIGIMSKLEPETKVFSNIAAHELHQMVLSAIKKINGNVVVVLDEVHQLVKVGGFDALYTLSNLESELEGTKSTVSIVAISNDLRFLEKLDAPIQSRLAAAKLLFTPYTQLQLAEILRERVSLVFTTEGLAQGVVEYAAALAARTHGDARQAIALMRKAVDVAAREGADQVHEEHVRQARGELELDMIAEGIRGLTLHDKMVLYAIASLSKNPRLANNFHVGKIYDSYANVCKNLGVDSMVMRSVVRSISDLADQGFVKSEVRAIGASRGRSTIVTMSVPTESTLRVLQEDSLFERTRENNPKTTTLDGFGG